MIGTPGSLLPGPTSPWSDEVNGVAGSPIGAEFNRGIVASQWVARRLGEKTVANHPGTKLLAAVATPGDPLRRELSGELRTALIGLLNRAKALVAWWRDLGQPPNGPRRAISWAIESRPGPE